jgi:hypothetical protein
MITAGHERAGITKQAVIKRELFFIYSSYDPLQTLNQGRYQDAIHQVREMTCVPIGGLAVPTSQQV